MLKTEIRDYEDEWWYNEATKRVDPAKLKPKKLRKKKCHNSSGLSGRAEHKKTN